MCGKLVRLAVTLLLISFLRLPCIGDKRLVAACETDRAAINALLGRLGIYDALGHTCSYFIHAPILDVT